MDLKRFNKLYYILTFTWGIIPNIFGGLATAALSGIFGAKTFFNYGRVVTVIGSNWGGLSLGNFVFMSNAALKSPRTLRHEIGHSLQNVFWGPLWLFVIGIPSMCRYWYRTLPMYKDHPERHTAYDDAWFEGQATAWGTKYTAAWDSAEDTN